tara:strand:- start:22 stop:642 length:621 start_codon:yes stop_codon:yes gene_type:complete
MSRRIGRCTFPNGTVYFGEYIEDVLSDGRVGWKPDGNGREVFEDGCVFSGSYKEGLREGPGKIDWTDKRSFMGTFVNDRPSGAISFVNPGGTTYNVCLDECETVSFGDLISDPDRIRSLASKGVVKFHYGGVYVGELVALQQHGMGKQTYPNGMTYEGEWERGKQHGVGTLTSDDGFVAYSGRWVEGNPSNSYRPLQTLNQSISDQ